MVKTLVKKLSCEGLEEISEEQKKAFRYEHAKRVGETIEFYKNLERKGLELARTRLIGCYSSHQGQYNQ